MSKMKSKGGMGFRNTRDFNVSLLGNHSWRLVKYPEKLVSKVFKARYYPNGTFLNAKIVCNPSYIWRSVLESQYILQHGIGCRVGNGQTISIFKDPWLPSDQDPFVHTRCESLQNEKVSSLMEINSNSWDVDLVLDIFDNRE